MTCLDPGNGSVEPHEQPRPAGVMAWVVLGLLTPGNCAGATGYSVRAVGCWPWPSCAGTLLAPRAPQPGPPLLAWC